MSETVEAFVNIAMFIHTATIHLVNNIKQFEFQQCFNENENNWTKGSSKIWFERV